MCLESVAVDSLADAFSARHAIIPPQRLRDEPKDRLLGRLRLQTWLSAFGTGCMFPTIVTAVFCLSSNLFSLTFFMYLLLSFREFLSQLLKAGFDPNIGFFKSTHERLLYPNPQVQ